MEEGGDRSWAGEAVYWTGSLGERLPWLVNRGQQVGEKLYEAGWSLELHGGCTYI